MAKIFSIPINPKLSETQYIEFVQFCDAYKDYISDLYFTCRIPPFNHWLLTGQIQKKFPELEVRSSILMDTKTATDVYNVVTSGFHSVCIDRALMRDHDTIKTIAKIKRKNPFKLGLLANEGCFGKCPVMAEHYNNTRTTGSQYFNNAISRVSCPKWDVTNPAVVLKTADIPAWKVQYDKKILNNIEDKSMWWNGAFITLVNKHKASYHDLAPAIKN